MSGGIVFGRSLDWMVSGVIFGRLIDAIRVSVGASIAVVNELNEAEASGGMLLFDCMEPDVADEVFAVLESVVRSELSKQLDEASLVLQS